MQSLLTARWPLALQQNKHSCIQQLQDVYLCVTNYGEAVGVPPTDASGNSEFLDLSSVRLRGSNMTESEAASCALSLDQYCGRHPHLCLFSQLSVCLSVCLSACLFMRLPAVLSVCLAFVLHVVRSHHIVGMSPVRVCEECMTVMHGRMMEHCKDEFTHGVNEMSACMNGFVAPQVDPQSIIMWGLRVRMAIATGAVESIKVWVVSSPEYLRPWV